MLLFHSKNIHLLLNSKGIILFYYLERGKVLTGEFYAHRFNQLDKKNRQTRLEVAKGQVRRCSGIGEIKRFDVRFVGISTQFSRFGSP